MQLAVLPSAPQKSTTAPAAAENAPGGSTGGVVQASYHANMPLDWESHMAAAITELEAQSKGTPKTDTEVAQRAYLQMLYLLAGRRDEALAPIPGARRRSRTSGPSSFTAWPRGWTPTTRRTAPAGRRKPSAFSARP